jgi:hypothetical protein
MLSAPMQRLVSFLEARLAGRGFEAIRDQLEEELGEVPREFTAASR